MGTDREPRDAAMLLTGLLIGGGGDGQLEVFRKRKAGDPSVDLDHLRRGRELLLSVFRAVKKGDEDAWERIEKVAHRCFN